MFGTGLEGNARVYKQERRYSWRLHINTQCAALIIPQGIALCRFISFQLISPISYGTARNELLTVFVKACDNV